MCDLVLILRLPFEIESEIVPNILKYSLYHVNTNIILFFITFYKECI